MRLWRISEFAALDGAGGMISAGRWHRRGRRVIYTAESPALALLEALVRFETGSLPERYQLLELEIPDDASRTEWAGSVPEEPDSQAWGSEWLASGATLLARVPAAVAPDSFNWLVNPEHPEAARLALRSARHWSWDPRLSR